MQAYMLSLVTRWFNVLTLRLIRLEFVEFNAGSQDFSALVSLGCMCGYMIVGCQGICKHAYPDTPVGQLPCYFQKRR